MSQVQLGGEKREACYARYSSGDSTLRYSMGYDSTVGTAYIIVAAITKSAVHVSVYEGSIAAVSISKKREYFGFHVVGICCNY